MRHILAVSTDSTRAVHYNPSKETVSVFKLPQKASAQSITPLETLSARVSSLTFLCIHPLLPIIAAIPYKASNLGDLKIPAGPSVTHQSSSNSIPQPNKTTMNRISIILYNHYTPKVLNSTTLTIELPETVTSSSSIPTPWCMKYSTCGRYLAVHTRTYRSSSSPIHQLFVIDSKKNYKCLESIKVDSGIEDIEWGLKNNIITASTDGVLRIYSFVTDENNYSMHFEQSYNLSSSPLSAMAYNIDQSSLLIGTRDGNTFYIDPMTMCCTHSELTNIDSPVLSILLGPLKTIIITYVSEHAHILRINDNDNEIKEICELKNIFNTYTTGCGVFCTTTGILVYLNKEGEVIFKNLNSTINPELKNKRSNLNHNRNHNNNGKNANKSSSVTNTSTNSSSNNNNSSKNKSSNDLKRRALDLFGDESNPKKEVKREPVNNSVAGGGNQKKDSYEQQREYWTKAREQNARSNRDRFNKRR